MYGKVQQFGLNDIVPLICTLAILRVPWTARRSNQSILKEISPEYSLEGLRLKLKLPILWPPDVKDWLIGKDPDAEKDWGQEEKGMKEDEMVGWHHWLNGHEFEWTPGVGDGQGGLVCCSPWGLKESDTIEQLNWTEQILYFLQMKVLWQSFTEQIFWHIPTALAHFVSLCFILVILTMFHILSWCYCIMCCCWVEHSLTVY